MNRFLTLKRYAFMLPILLKSIISFGQCTTTTNCTGVTENFDNSNSIGASGFSTTDYNFNGVATNKFLESTNGNSNNANATANIKTLLTNTFSTRTSGSSILLTFELGRILSNTNGALNITSYTINAVTESNTGPRTLLCSGGTVALSSTPSKLCFDFFTTAALANQFVKFELVFKIQASANQNHLTFDNFGTNLDASPSSLPVTFVDFKAKNTAKGMQLTWKVAGENNVKQYDVERSTAGTREFTKIGSVAATGNDIYSFMDVATPGSAVYYRIKNVDYDGRFKFSTVLLLKNEVSSVVFKVVPTAVSGNATIQHNCASGTALISITTTDGKVVRNIRPAAGAMQTTVDMSGLQRGLYLLKWSDGSGQVEVAKVVKQ